MSRDTDGGSDAEKYSQCHDRRNNILNFFAIDHLREQIIVRHAGEELLHLESRTAHRTAVRKDCKCRSVSAVRALELGILTVRTVEDIGIEDTRTLLVLS